MHPNLAEGRKKLPNYSVRSNLAKGRRKHPVLHAPQTGEAEKKIFEFTDADKDRKVPSTVLPVVILAYTSRGPELRFGTPLRMRLRVQPNRPDLPKLPTAARPEFTCATRSRRDVWPSKLTSANKDQTKDHDRSSRVRTGHE